jgi:AcrR family transcriptional regulator
MSAVAVPARRTQAERRAASEEVLLRAAAEVIAERGVERASLRSIGQRAGASRAMPGYHFGSKEALIARLAQRGHELTLAAAIDALERARRDVDERSKLDVLQVMFETFLEVFATDAPEERAVVVMWGATFASDGRLSALTESDRGTHGSLAEHIREGQREGSIRGDIDADAAAMTAMGMLRGVAGLTLAHADLADATRVRTLCTRAILDMLRPNQEPAANERLRPAPRRPNKSPGKKGTTDATTRRPR